MASRPARAAQNGAFFVSPGVEIRQRISVVAIGVGRIHHGTLFHESALDS